MKSGEVEVSKVRQEGDQYRGREPCMQESHGNPDAGRLRRVRELGNLQTRTGESTPKRRR